MYGCFACMYVYHLCAWCQGVTYRVLDPLELEVQVVGSYPVGLGIKSRASERAANALT